MEKHDTNGAKVKIPKNMSKKDYKSFVSRTRKEQWDGKGESLKDSEVLLDGQKRKVAILLSYSGRNYHGLQHNPGDENVDTIEKRVFEALVKAKVVYSNVLVDRKKCGYQSCSRTDKGVSAIGNVASLKCVYVDQLEEKINEHLPDDIRISGIQRVTKGFDAKNRCTHRTYSYYCPTYCFSPPAEWTNSSSYRITDSHIKFINELLARYVGTKSYHNFTSGKRQGDMSAKRNIISFEIQGEPFLQSDMEYVELRVKGQSFMIHQIRKMVGLIIARAGGHCAEDHWDRAFNNVFEDIPKAPGNGLVLRQVHYDTYNKDYGQQHGQVDWASSQDFMDKFARNKILPEIFQLDMEEDNMMDWLKTISIHDFTGERAAEQWKKQEFFRIENLKRKADDADEGEQTVKKDCTN